jgi:hypothetical protein
MALDHIDRPGALQDSERGAKKRGSLGMADEKKFMLRIMSGHSQSPDGMPVGIPLNAVKNPGHFGPADLHVL